MLYHLKNYEAHQAAGAGDLLVEFQRATLVAGTITVPTSFEQDCIEAVLITQCDASAINSQEAFVCTGVAGVPTVTTGTLTINGITASVASVNVMIVGRMKYVP